MTMLTRNLSGEAATVTTTAGAQPQLDRIQAQYSNTQAYKQTVDRILAQVRPRQSDLSPILQRTKTELEAQQAVLKEGSADTQIKELKIRIDELEASIKKLEEIPGRLQKFLMSGASLKVASHLTAEGRNFIEERFMAHSFGEPAEDVKLIERKIGDFHKEVSHLFQVNEQLRPMQVMRGAGSRGFDSYFESLKSQGGLTGIQKLARGENVERSRQYLRQIQEKFVKYPEIGSLTATFNMFHDAGKWEPGKDAKTGANNYGAHPYIGLNKLNDFFGSEKQMFDVALLPKSLKSRFTQAELNTMLKAIQIGHNNFSGPPLGENSRLVLMELFQDPKIKVLMQDKEKRDIFLTTLALTTTSDLASLGFLSDEKVAAYFDEAETVSGFFDADPNLIAPKYANVNAKDIVMQYIGTPEDDFWYRFVGVVTANTTPGSEQRTENGGIKEMFERFLQESYGDRSKEILEKLQRHFTQELRGEYKRNPFQQLMIAYPEKDKVETSYRPWDQRTFSEVSGFDKKGLDFYLAIVDRETEICRELESHPKHPMEEGSFFQTLYSQGSNIQGFDPVSHKFFHQVVSDPHRAKEYLAQAKPEYDKNRQCWKIVFPSFKDFVK